MKLKLLIFLKKLGKIVILLILTKLLSYLLKNIILKKKTLGKYKKEYIIEKKIEIKTSVFDDIKYDMDIIKNYIIGSNSDFINNFDKKNIFEKEIDFDKISKKLNSCKKFSSYIKYNGNNDDDYLIKESLVEHNIPYSNNNKNNFNLQNPFSSFPSK